MFLYEASLISIILLLLNKHFKLTKKNSDARFKSSSNFGGFFFLLNLCLVNMNTRGKSTISVGVTFQSSSPLLILTKEKKEDNM